MEPIVLFGVQFTLSLVAYALKTADEIALLKHAAGMVESSRRGTWRRGWPRCRAS